MNKATTLEDHLTARIAVADRAARDPRFSATTTAYNRGFADGLRYARQYVLCASAVALAADDAVVRTDIHTDGEPA